MKKLNKEAGLNSFVLLVGTGLQNVHMSIEALQRYQKNKHFLNLRSNVKHPLGTPSTHSSSPSTVQTPTLVRRFYHI